ncbi:glucose 1-dehydrogenase [Rhodococcus olei]|uniref:Glucose 1-dehydrogenase n=1 Tax=Rhodococcus olei TaxID=2161675 RepID=A0ABP8PSR0_9NOCA
MTTMDGKVAIVTGATVVGGRVNIGGAIAGELVARGARVMVTDIDTNGAHALATQLSDKYGADSVSAHIADIRSESDIERLVAATLSTFGTVDTVINNAGVFPVDDGAVADIDIEVWDDVMAVNVRGAMLLTKHALPIMLAKARGSIVNTASTHAFAGDLRLTGYGASKAAVNALTVYTATQYGRRGIRCNAVCPGTTTSPPVERAPGWFREVYARHTINPSLNAPMDVARAVAFLASDDASGVNGLVMRVDGGLLAHQPFYADQVDVG